MIPASAATACVADRFHDTFDIGPDSARFILDKTAANSLRLPYLYKLFPDAIFLHIIRDGRDVAVSVRRKYMGDGRKITKVATNDDSSVTELKSGWQTLSHKIRTGISPMRLVREPRRYIAAGLRTIGVGTQYPWGPAVPGLAAMIRSHSILEIAAYQWRCCVEQALAFRITYPGAMYVEVRYEDLISNARVALIPVCEQLGVEVPSTISTDIVSGGTTYVQALSQLEREQIQTIAGWTLAELGYY